MTTLAELQALSSVNTSVAKDGDKVVFKGVNNIVLQYVEGVSKFKLGDVYTIDSVITFGLHEVRVKEVTGWHFANLFASVPEGYTGLTDAPVAAEETIVEKVVEAVKEVVEELPLVKKSAKAKKVVEAAAEAAPAVAAAGEELFADAPKLASAATNPVEAVEAAVEVAPAIEAAAEKVEEVVAAAKE